MTSRAEKGAAEFEGLKLRLCENPLPPIYEAIVAAQAEAPRGNFYTEAYSRPFRQLISERLAAPERFVHISAGSELILRQLFDRLGEYTAATELRDAQYRLTLTTDRQLEHNVSRATCSTGAR